MYLKRRKIRPFSPGGVLERSWERCLPQISRKKKIYVDGIAEVSIIIIITL